MRILSEDQLRRYRFDGYLFPVNVMASAEARHLLDNLESMEARIGAPLPRADMKWRGGAHIYSPWVNTLVRDPRILNVMEDVIGPDILVFWSTFFIKDPGTPHFTAWHQDATYFGLEPHEHVTAWLALSDASKEAGCMDVISSQGAPRQMRHAAARLANSINGAGQLITEYFDDTRTTSMSLRAGEMSLHHTLCRHSSAANNATYRRVGLGISYIPAHVRSTGSSRMPALLVRGSNRHDNFDLLPDPIGELDPASIAMHERAYRRFRENYYEQERLHTESFSQAP